jgi:glycerophosphoryl diester phosphodiesterase
MPGTSPAPHVPFLAAVLLIVCAAVLSAQQPLRLIAHRGGVVDGHHPENSLGAARDAIARGYWMLEIDLQETSDGRIVVHHDDFMKSFGAFRMPADLTMDQIGRLHAVEDNSTPPEFSDFAAACKGKIQLMIDTKPPHHPLAFYQSMEATLRRNGLLEGAFFIGTDEARAYFKGKARVSIGEAELEKKLAAGEDVARDYFLFEHGTTLDAQGIALAKQAGIPAVVSINAEHYAGTNHMLAAHADIERLLPLGVTDFQIDSDYDIWLR